MSFSPTDNKIRHSAILTLVITGYTTTCSATELLLRTTELSYLESRGCTAIFVIRTTTLVSYPATMSSFGTTGECFF